MSPDNKDKKDVAGSFASLTFVGEITASVTHELSNVVGTIEQVSGLIEDLTYTPEIQDAGIAERLMDVVERVARQTERGTTLIRRLNRFAHLADNEKVECDLAQVLENVAALSERLVNLKKVNLVTSGLADSLPLICNPLMVAQSVFGMVKRVLSTADGSEPLRIELVGVSRGALVTVSARVGTDVADDMMQAPENLPLEAFGGSLAHRTENGRFILELTVPNSAGE
ncbi:MAG TPA: hypothetical protein PLF13_04605 [candidate division Zixibacteria bacterium]|nr:hypothetical protein [candidate division Zixibacteria bacterium]